MNYFLPQHRKSPTSRKGTVLQTEGGLKQAKSQNKTGGRMCKENQMVHVVMARQGDHTTSLIDAYVAKSTIHSHKVHWKKDLDVILGRRPGQIKKKRPKETKKKGTPLQDVFSIISFSVGDFL